MEVQLEEGYDEKQKVLKEKREMEAKLLSAQDQVTPDRCHIEAGLVCDMGITEDILPNRSKQTPSTQNRCLLHVSSC